MGDRSTSVILCEGVPIGPDYQHTLFFPDINTQREYYYSVSIAGANLMSYQRWDNPSVKVPIPIATCQKCNYMRFVNTTYGDKAIYAFIDDVRYISDTSSEIFYTIDVIQTFWFDVEILPCFVEREHVEDDTIGLHTLPEPVEIGPYLFQTVWSDANPEVSFLTVHTNSAMTIIPNIDIGYDGEYTGVAEIIDNSLEDVNRTLALFSTIDLLDDLLGVFIIPRWVYDSNCNRTITLMDGAHLVGYSPRNNKLLTWPYCYLTVSNNRGEEGDFKYELFRGTGKPVFTERFEVSIEPLALFWPENYNSYGPASFAKRPSTYMTINGYPRVSLSKSSVLEWAQTQGLAWAIKGGLAYITAGSSTAISNVPSAESLQGFNAVSKIIGHQFQSFVNGAFNPPKMVSGGGSQLLLRGNLELCDFTLIHKSIRAEYAEIIDNFFDMYGYQVNTVKKPNIGTRPAYNYVKTANALIRGKIPAKYEKEFVKALDNGITFWKDAAQVGLYNTPNQAGE